MTSCGVNNISVREFLETFSHPKHIIGNVYNIRDKSFLPVINVSVQSHKIPFLLDTGSTVSIMNCEAFDFIKSNVKFKNLSNHVYIKTVNSTLACNKAIELNFKVGNSSFKHVFYIVNISSSNFSGILGYDFISQYNLQILPSQNLIRLNEETLPLVTENLEHKKQTNHLSRSQKVFIHKKTIIPPHDTVQVNLKVEGEISSKFILFQPKINNHGIEAHEAVHSVDQNTFSSFITNITDYPVHLNKNSSIGTFSSDIVIREVNNPSKSEQLPVPEYCNLIQPSNEIIELRRTELSCDDFHLDHLTDQQRSTFQTILIDRFLAFSKSTKSLGCTDLVKPQITFKSNNAIKTLPFPIPQALQDSVKEELDSMVAAGLIRRTVSDWACPLLLVKKKSDPSSNEPQKFRLVLDLRLLNSIINNSTYPLPKIQDLLHHVSKYKYYSSLDLKSAYQQILLPEELQDVLTFTSPFGTFANNRLVFGLKTAASTFQALVDTLIDELVVNNITGIKAYQDDFIIGAQSFEEMTTKIEAVLNILIKYNLTLAPDKCSFFKEEINFLGFHLSFQKISPITCNIQKITSFPTPKTPRQVKKFLGICGFYRHLIPNFAQRTSLLNELTKKSSKFKWTLDHQVAFDHLQSIFFKQPFVKMPQWDSEFVLQTDASKSGISGILLQQHDDQLHPISYFSKSLSKSEKQYPAIKLELMAIHHAILAFKSYIYNRKFKLITDAKPLLHYKKTSSPADIVTRWLLDISEFEFEFQHIPGKLNSLPDYLSRLEDIDQHKVQVDPVKECSDLNLPFLDHNFEQEELHHINVSEDSPNDISISTILSEQLNDPHTSELLNILQDPSLKNSNLVKSFFINKSSSLLMFKASRKLKPQIVLPSALKPKALAIAHLSHFGIQKTYELVSQKFFWKNLYEDVKNFVLSCDFCIRHKSYAPKPAPLKSIWIPSAPSEFVSIDLVGPFKNSSHIFTIIDHFSRHLILYPVHTISAKSVTRHLLHYIATFGRPAFLLSDLGTQFTSETFELVNKLLGITLVHSSSNHPATNGVSERINTQIKSSINTLLDNNVSFENAILIHQSLYNGSVHSSTKFTPNVIHFGRNIPLLFDTFNMQTEPQQLDQSHYIDQIMSQLKSAYQMNYDNLIHQQNLQNSRQHQNAKLRVLQVNDIVYLKDNKKFKSKFTGPFSVVEKVGTHNYKIQTLDNHHSTPFLVHVDRLRKAPPRFGHLLNNVSPGVSSTSPNQHRYFLRSHNQH